MIKKVGNLADGKLLSHREQMLILGGKRMAKDCSTDGVCDPGFCCSHGSCIDDTPGPDGTIPACE